MLKKSDKQKVVGKALSGSQKHKPVDVFFSFFFPPIFFFSIIALCHHCMFNFRYTRNLVPVDGYCKLHALTSYLQ